MISTRKHHSASTRTCPACTQREQPQPTPDRAPLSASTSTYPMTNLRPQRAHSASSHSPRQTALAAARAQALAPACTQREKPHTVSYAGMCVGANMNQRREDIENLPARGGGSNWERGGASLSVTPLQLTAPAQLRTAATSSVPLLSSDPQGKSPRRTDPDLRPPDRRV
jgi:hypothetical protein